jgi:hypothetical protein
MIQRGNIWHRNVPWATGDYWRTDISANTLCSASIHFARYALKDGPIVQVPLSDLRDALEHAPTRKDGTIIGPYNIYPFKSVIEVLGHQTKVRMEFGPFDDLDLDRLTTYHSKTVTPVDKPRPRVGLDFYGMADIVLDKVRSGQTSFDRVIDRLQEFNPTVSVRVTKDGSITRDEMAYCLMVNALRAFRNSWEDVV